VHGLDFSSWQAIVSTLLGIIVVSLVAVGIRLAVMNGVQQRHARQNRQINERLKTLIAAYKTLGGSFTGDLAVDPRHRRDLRSRAAPPADAAPDAATDAPAGSDATAASREAGSSVDAPGAERRRRVRDAVEAALSDVILLGTEEQVRLASRAANEMVAGRSVEIDELVVSLRTFIREVLDLDAVPPEVTIPRQGPLRAGGGGGGRAGGGAERAGGGRGGGRAGGGGSGGAGLGGGIGAAAAVATPHPGDVLDADEGQPPSAGR
jgi:heme exporter protein D